MFRHASGIVASHCRYVNNEQRAHLVILQPIGVLVADVDQVYADLRARDIAVLGEPADRVWATRMTTFVDPDGNNLSLLPLQMH